MLGKYKVPFPVEGRGRDGDDLFEQIGTPLPSPHKRVPSLLREGVEVGQALA